MSAWAGPCPCLAAALDEGMMALCLENQLPCSKIDLGKDVRRAC